MPTNFGIFVEEEISMAINNKRVNQLPTNLKFTLYRIFGPMEDEEIVHCERIGDHNKPDIWVEYKGEKKYISIKSGKAKEVHSEPIKTFVPFLQEIGMSETSIQFFKEYCYGDGTDDGTGGDVLDFPDLKAHFLDRSAIFNRELISNPDLIIKIIDRCVFKGSHKDATPADYLYFGNAEFGDIMSRKQVMRHITQKTWGFMTNPHIGPLQFKMHIRGKVRFPENEYKRHMVDIWWANLESDVHYITRRYNF